MSRDLGREYEEKALKYLINHGFELVVNNYHSRWGEIDLIVQKSNLLVFVEVKYRSRTDYGRGYEAVGRSKQKKIYKTAQSFLCDNSYDEFDIRFDIISYDNSEVNWIKNCFWGDELGF